MTWGVLLVLFAGGVVIGVCSLLVHRHAWWLNGVPLPWGLVLSLATDYLCVRAAAVVRGLAGAASLAAGWVAVLLGTLAGRPEGDYLIAADLRGYGYLLGGAAVVGLALVRTVLVSGPNSDFRLRR